MGEDERKGDGASLWLGVFVYYFPSSQTDEQIAASLSALQPVFEPLSASARSASASHFAGDFLKGQARVYDRLCDNVQNASIGYQLSRASRDCLPDSAEAGTSLYYGEVGLIHCARRCAPPPHPRALGCRAAVHCHSVARSVCSYAGFRTSQTCSTARITATVVCQDRDKARVSSLSAPPLHTHTRHMHAHTHARVIARTHARTQTHLSPCLHYHRCTPPLPGHPSHQ